jgi:hypothetical protein
VDEIRRPLLPARSVRQQRSRSPSAKGFHKPMQKPQKAENHLPWKMPRPFASGELGGYPHTFRMLFAKDMAP